jgi:chaperonin GroES
LRRERRTFEVRREARIFAGQTHPEEADIMKLRPLHDRVVIKRLKEEEKTAGGIIIPDTAKEKPVEAKVVAVGNGKILEDGTLRKPGVKVGDTVLFAKYTGSEIKVGDEDHVVLREDDILAVIEK